MVEEWKTINGYKKPKVLSVLVLVVIIISSIVTISLLADWSRLAGWTKEKQTNITSYTTNFTSIRPYEAHLLIINNANLTIIDVRECKCSFDKEHILGAIWDRNPEKFYNSTNDLLVYCSNGMENSEIFCDKLINHTWGSIYHLEGGIEAWIRAGFKII